MKILEVLSGVLSGATNKPAVIDTTPSKQDPTIYVIGFVGLVVLVFVAVVLFKKS